MYLDKFLGDWKHVKRVKKAIAYSGVIRKMSKEIYLLLKKFGPHLFL